MPFQTQVNIQPAPAVAGDFASSNPRASVLAGPGEFVAGVGGVVVGRFAWAGSIGSGTYSRTVSNFGAGAPTGFLAREQQGLITVFLQEASMVIPQGLPVTLYNEGDFWVVNSGAAEAYPGLKAYANNGTGLATFGVTATPPAGFSYTASIAAGAGSATTSTITDNIFTIGTLASGNFWPGSTLSGSGVVTGTVILSQLTGTAGGSAGATYMVSIPGQAVTSTTITGAHGIMTVTAATTGSIAVGDTIVAGGGGNSATVAGTYVSALGTGTGGLGTYIVSNNTVVTSGTIAGNAATETKWYSASFGASGELIKMTSWPVG